MTDQTTYGGTGSYGPPSSTYAGADVLNEVIMPGGKPSPLRTAAGIVIHPIVKMGGGHAL